MRFGRGSTRLLNLLKLFLKGFLDEYEIQFVGSTRDVTMHARRVRLLNEFELDIEDLHMIADSLGQ